MDNNIREDAAAPVGDISTAVNTNGEAAAAPLRLDPTIQTSEERNELVKRIIAQTPPEKLTPKYLDILATYITYPLDKKERLENKIITDNHASWVSKRQTSFEGLVQKFENGEDAIYGMIANDKNIIFTPKVEITQKDIQEIPGLQQLVDAIHQVEQQYKQATGKRKAALRKQLIQMRKDQYVLRGAYRSPIYCLNATRSFNNVSLDQEISLDEKGEFHIQGTFSLLNPDHVSAVLLNYSKLKEDSWGQFRSDSYYMLIDFENLVDRTLEDKYPMLYDLVIYKIDGKTNQQIQDLLNRDYGIRHSFEYLSSLWRKKIPKMIAEEARKEWLIWHYTFEVKGKWKRCSRCKEIKPAHNLFFSKNNTSKDGFYSICKECRSQKNKEKKMLPKSQV